MRKTVSIALAILLMLCFATVAQAAPQVVLDGKTLNFEVPLTVEDGRTLVPLRAIFEGLGADVSWDGTTNTVTATRLETEIKLTIGGQALMNGKPVALQVPAKVINGRTMVPLRFVGEAMGCTVGWDSTTQIVSISSAGFDGSATFAAKVHFIDVGQADAIYIELPNHDDILIDAGNEADGPTVVNYLENEGVDDIELLIATHPHEDHIGGIPDVLDAYKVESIVDSGKTADSAIYKEYAAKAKAEGAVWQADNHQTYTFGSVALQILTGPETWEDLNDYSVVCRLDTGDIEFLLMGDAEGPAEAALSGQLDANVLKVGHHGSSTSSSTAFLNKVKPQNAVISVGVGNKYKHPSAETIQRLKDAGTNVLRTDLDGNIVVKTDGESYIVKTGPVKISVPQTLPKEKQPVTEGKYVGSSESDKYHYPTCRYAEKITPENKIWFKDEAAAQAAGYEPCGVCKP